MSDEETFTLARREISRRSLFRAGAGFGTLALIGPLLAAANTIFLLSLKSLKLQSENSIKKNCVKCMQMVNCCTQELIKQDN